MSLGQSRLTSEVGRKLGARPRLTIFATVLVFGTAGLLARYAFHEPTPPPTFGGAVPPPAALQEAIDATFSDVRCVAPAHANRLVRSKLHELGLDVWTIRTRADAKDAECVAVGLDGYKREVVLFTALGQGERRAIGVARQELMDSCYLRDDAAVVVEQALRDEGLSEWDLRTDGPVGGQEEQWDEIMSHVDQGCWILSATGWTAEGKLIIWLGGR